MTTALPPSALRWNRLLLTGAAGGLGRVLRPRPGKQAVLYEVISRDTAEENISQRRGNVAAFQAEGELW